MKWDCSTARSIKLLGLTTQKIWPINRNSTAFTVVLNGTFSPQNFAATVKMHGYL